MNKRDLLDNAKSALVGYLNENVKAVAVGWDPKTGNLILRYYLSRPATDDDVEMCSCAITEIIALFWKETVTAKDECVYTQEPIANLEALDGFVYVREGGENA